MKYFDIHTHHPSLSPEVFSICNMIIGVTAPEWTHNKSRYYSAGIHPWYITDPALQLSILEKQLEKPEVIALGECGLDKLAKIPMDTQKEVFIRQVELAGIAGKPLIIHCVKAWDELMAIKGDTGTRLPWIIHGFRGNATLASQLQKKGFYLSFGQYFNEETVRATDSKRFFTETDDSDLDIRILYEKLADTLAISTEELKKICKENVEKTFAISFEK